MSDLYSHGFVCLSGDPVLRVAYQVSDAVIWGSYVAISATLWVASKGTAIRSQTLYLAFIVFIFLCGQDHLMDVLNKFQFTPAVHGWLYPIDGYGVRPLTAFVSAITAIVLFRLRKLLRAAFIEIASRAVLS